MRVRSLLTTTTTTRTPQLPLVPRCPVARLPHDNDTYNNKDPSPISAVEFTADGKYCLTGGHDRTVRLWNPSRLDPAFPPSRPTTTATTQHDDDVPVHDLPTSLCLQTYRDGLTHPVSALCIDPTSQTLLTACDKALVVHDVVTGQQQRHGRKRLGTDHHTSRIQAVALGPHAHTYLSAAYEVCLWDARNAHAHAPIQILKDARDMVTAVHTRGHVIYTASVDGCVRTYDVRMGILQEDQLPCALTHLAVSHDGQCLAAHGLDDATIRLLDAASTTTDASDAILLNTLVGAHRAGTYALQSAFTSDDLAVVTGSEDGSAVVYHAITAQPLAVLEGHLQPTCAVAASPTNTAMVTASYDGNAIVWADSPDYMRWVD